jgi:hypothetical protein
MFLTPMAAVAAAPAMRRFSHPLVVGLLAGQAVVVELLFRTPW